MTANSELSEPVDTVRSKTGVRSRKLGRLLVVALLGGISGIAAYGWLVEAQNLATRHVKLGNSGRLRIAHISDLHYAGNKGYLSEVVAAVNAAKPDVICITGDFVSNSRWVVGIVEQLSGLAAPVFAVPGNWDYWSGADLDQLALFCERTGGRLLLDESAEMKQFGLVISGALGESAAWIPDQSESKHILLVHYPQFVDSLKNQQFDVILAGHSHGGQVRLPWIGAPFVPYGVGQYDLGLFETSAGPLYVTSGIGTSALPIRLGCRPEVAIIDL